VLNAFSSIGDCPLPILHAISAMGTQLCFYQKPRNQVIVPSRIPAHPELLTDTSPEAHWDCNILGWWTRLNRGVRLSEAIMLWRYKVVVAKDRSQSSKRLMRASEVKLRVFSLCRRRNVNSCNNTKCELTLLSLTLK
jgi:hypothetical protein